MRKFEAQYEVDLDNRQIVFRAPSEKILDAKAKFKEYLKAVEDEYCK